MYCMIPDPFPSTAFGKGSATRGIPRLYRLYFKLVKGLAHKTTSSTKKQQIGVASFSVLGSISILIIARSEECDMQLQCEH